MIKTVSVLCISAPTPPTHTHTHKHTHTPLTSLTWLSPNKVAIFSMMGTPPRLYTRSSLGHGMCEDTSAGCQCNAKTSQLSPPLINAREACLIHLRQVEKPLGMSRPKPFSPSGKSQFCLLHWSFSDFIKLWSSEILFNWSSGVCRVQCTVITILTRVKTAKMRMSVKWKTIR